MLNLKDLIFLLVVEEEILLKVHLTKVFSIER